MNIEHFIQELQISHHLLAILLGTPRLLMLFQTAPFLGGSIVTGTLRMAVTLACYLIMHPFMLAHIPEKNLGGDFFNIFFYASLIIKEIIIGMLLGLVSGILFWAIQATGTLIDNQRGAAQAMGADILSGDQASPLGSFLLQSVIYVFFMGGGFLVFLRLIFATYEFWPVMSLLPVNIVSNQSFVLFFAEQVSYLMTLCILLSGPIIVAFLLTDISLGLMNRFASQLNVYILAMPIKSAIAAFLLIFYFAILLDEVTPLFHKFIDNVQHLRSLV